MPITEWITKDKYTSSCVLTGREEQLFFSPWPHVVRSQIIPAYVIAFLGNIPVQYCTASPVLSDKDCNSLTRSGEPLWEQIQLLKWVKVHRHRYGLQRLPLDKGRRTQMCPSVALFSADSGSRGKLVLSFPVTVHFGRIKNYFKFSFIWCAIK